jgi:hypothetical protein
MSDCYTEAKQQFASHRCDFGSCRCPPRCFALSSSADQLPVHHLGYEDFPVGRKLEVHEGVVLKMGDGPGRTSLDGLFVQILDAVD